jgi:hypothetical protein
MSQLREVRYPLSIVFPLGSYVFNLACKDVLLVTYVRRLDFEDKLAVFEGIIKSNNDILKSKHLNSPVSYKKRKGLDN